MPNVLHVASLLLAACPLQAAPQSDAPAGGSEIAPRDWLVIAPLDTRARRPFNPSAVLAAHLLDRDAPAPSAGAMLTGELGSAQPWQAVAAGANGTDASRFAAAAATIERPRDEVVLARLTGAGTLWIDGTPQIGDLYGDGIGGLPVALKRGTNRLLVTGIRGAFGLSFAPPAAPLIANPFDATLPDLVAGAPVGIASRVSVAIVVVNASTTPWAEIAVEHGSADAAAPFRAATTIDRAGLPPLGLRKIALELDARADCADFMTPGRIRVPITVRAGGHVAATELALEVKPPLALRRQTHVSRIDGSVQEYAVLPPSDGAADALVLTLHGAGVDCMGQAGSYSAKPDFWIVAPTNRRRFGFDWQDWGRRDAYETLADACFRIGGELRAGTSSIDPTRPHRRIYLTGHSMGGHGTWHLAANDPATFAAIAPSAGWSSFDSYGGGRPTTARSELWHAADGASRTLALIDNLKQLPTFVLHGSADDNVPASEARLMLDALTAAGAKPASHLEEGAGHWWDGAAAPGADCVDWPAIFELFRASVRPARVDRVSFTSQDPSTQASCDWVHVQQLERYGEPFRIDAAWDPTTRSGTVTTSNVTRLWLRTPDLADVAAWTIDGTTPTTTAAGRRPRDQWFERVDGSWRPVGRDATPAPEESWTTSRKIDVGWCGPGIGPFKRAFDHQFVLVYGTQGTATETREMLDRARYDAAHWWYRANGRALLVSDAQWLALDRGRALLDERDLSMIDQDMNVLLYGNRDSNAAWAELVPTDAPFDAARGKLRLGDQLYEGDALGACVVLPRRYHGLVGLFADTGARGTRLGYALAHFISGVGYPDYALFDATILTAGDGGVLAAGFFDAHWRLQPAR